MLKLGVKRQGADECGTLSFFTILNPINFLSHDWLY